MIKGDDNTDLITVQWTQAQGAPSLEAHLTLYGMFSGLSAARTQSTRFNFSNLLVLHMAVYTPPVLHLALHCPALAENAVTLQIRSHVLGPNGLDT